jgi:hypothetical protein
MSVIMSHVLETASPFISHDTSRTTFLRIVASISNGSIGALLDKS